MDYIIDIKFLVEMCLTYCSMIVFYLKNNRAIQIVIHTDKIKISFELKSQKERLFNKSAN
jgi:hypothetical protein